MHQVQKNELYIFTNSANLFSRMRASLKNVLIMLEAGFPYSHRLLEGIIKYIEKRPYIRIQALDFRRRKEPEWLNMELSYDGIVWMANPSDSWAKKFIGAEKPIVSACSRWPGNKVTTVAFSDESLVHTALDYLCGLDRPNTGIVLYNEDDDSGFTRRKTNFLQKSSKRGLRAMEINLGRQKDMECNPPKLNSKGISRLKQFLKSPHLPASVWAMNDYVGYSIIETAVNLGVKIPEQLAVLGAGDYAVARYSRPLLSTIPFPGEIIGYESMKILDEMMSNKSDLKGRVIAIQTPSVIERESTHITDSNNEQIRIVYDFIREYACRGITTDDLLQIVPLSQPTLNKRFKKEYGVTTGEAIRAEKISKAKYYLKITSFSISRVAELCGYSSQAKFANFFKRETNTTPSQYRKKACDQP